MNVGLPGIGLGGLFYMVSALIMPFVSVYRVLSGQRDGARWGLVLRQSTLALAILLTIVAEFWILERAIGAVRVSSPSLEAHSAAAARVVETSPVVFAFGTVILLWGLLATVEAAGVYQTRRSRRRRTESDPNERHG